MAEQAYAYVTLIPVAKGFKGALTKELSGLNSVGASAGAGVGNSFSNSFSLPLTRLAGIAGAALAGIGFGRFVKDSIREASDLGESINAVTVSYGEFADDVLALGDDVAGRLGLTTTDFNAAAVRFSAFTERIAGEGGNVAGVVDTLTTRAADFASVFNIDVSEALQVFQSGLAGEAEPLKRFGVNLLDSEVRAFAAANGIGEVGRQLTETEKVQARYGLLLESTAKTQGDFANTSSGLANSQRILQATLGNLRAEVGESLTPAMARFSSGAAILAQEIFPQIASFVETRVAPALNTVSQIFQDIAINARESGFSLGAVFDNLSMLVTDWIDGGGLTRLFERFIEMREVLFNALANALPAIIDALVEFIPQLVSFFTDQVLPTVLESFTFVVDELANLIVDLLPKLVGALLELIPGILTAALDVFDSLIEALVEITPMLIDTLIDLLPKLVNTIVEMLPEIVSAAVELFTGLVEGLVEVIPVLLDGIIEMIPQIISAILDALPKIIDAAFELFSGLINGLIDATPDIVDAVIDLIPEITGALIEAVPQLIEAGFELISGLAKGIIDNAPRILGNAIQSAGEIMVNGIKDFLGIRSPSRVFMGIGQNVAEGLANGIEDNTDLVTDAAKALGDAAVTVVDSTVAGIEEKFTTISSIPGILSTALEETVRLSMSQVRKMAEETEGLYALFNEAGDLVSSYSGYGTNPLNDAFNSVLKYMGVTSIAGINKTAQDLFGGTMQQVLDATNPNPQATLIDPKTGMTRTIGAADEQSLAMAIERAMAEGFTDRLAPIATPLEDLNQNIEKLIDTVAREGLTPFASGGFVTGPTPALIGEAGPEVVMPLDRFESIMGLTDQNGKTLNYYAAPNKSVDSEAELFQAMRRAKVVANW